MGPILSLNGPSDKPGTIHHIPLTIFRVDVESGELSVWSRRNVRIDDDIEVRQLMYPSKDGTIIPMFTLQRAALGSDPQNRVLLTGYGGFGRGLKPWFRPEAVAWVQLGGIYVVANVRGGNEFGEEWHRAAMREGKQRAIDDFCAAAEYLIRERVTTAGRIGIAGTSNGGLLVGAAVTQRPELFGAAICRYPLLDMLRYHRFGVARWWLPEYGSPDDPEAFRYLYAYSPYHRVESGVAYPAVLLETGDLDTRVDPCHARKMAAALQASTRSGRPVLLREKRNAGHTMDEPLAGQIDDLTDDISFLCWQLASPI